MEYRFNQKGDWGIKIADVVLENGVTAEEIKKKKKKKWGFTVRANNISQ